jgi:tRNA-2-methylthio-N6-dimethylallyladenosine synthase
MRTYHIETFGCQMNEHDSEGIAGILSRLGMSRVPSADQADVVVLNTCSVRDKPHRKAFARLDGFRLLKQERPELMVIVAGCMAQLIPDEIQARAPHVDLLVGPRSYAKLESALGQLLEEPGSPAILLDRCAPDSVTIPFERDNPRRAWVNVMFGCDNYCAYCVVPHARGPEVSRCPEAVVEEMRALAENGVVEVTLLGQNVNSYGRGLHPTIDFADLLERVNAVEGIRRVRFTTSHPKGLSPRLVDAMAGLENVCEHLHLPVQAGSDGVLARMGRGHTAEDYRRLVSSARVAIAGLSLTTDVMVGFPGETEEDFEHTLALFQGVRYDQAFMFKYNDRPGTRAVQLPDKVPETEKQRRLEALVELQNRVAREINEVEVGRGFEVLVDGPDQKTPGRMRGRTRQNKLMIFEGRPDLAGRFVTVRTVEPRLWGWIGELVAVEGD